jgi:pyruvate dehydrogenase E1 component alpha subunit
MLRQKANKASKVAKKGANKVAKKVAKKVQNIEKVNKPTKRTMSTVAPATDEVAKFKVGRAFKVHKLDSAPLDEIEISKTQMLNFYKEMALYRRVEIVADTLYKQRLIRGFCHLYDGQEAVLVGLEANIKKTDSIITAYRAHCHQISRGDTIESMFAELMGRQDGCSRGKGGSMHTYFTENNFYGGNGIVGAQVPLGAGIAFAHKYNKDNGICISAYGDGAANQGQVYEAANMAAMWKLPLIFLCENNDYAMGTATARHAASTSFYTRGDYVPGLWFDGQDIVSSYSAWKFASEYVRGGNGPLFVEASTYRYHGHSMSDPGLSYRTRDEVSNVRATRDPIDNCRNRIFEAGFATPADIKQIDKDIKETVDIAVEKAKASPQPPMNELFEHIYSGAPPEVVRNVELSKSVSPKL